MKNFDSLKKHSFFKKIVLKKGEYLFHEGEMHSYLYIVETGKLSVEKNTLLDGKTKKLAVVEKGAILGEATLFQSKPKEVSVFALTKSVIWKIESQKDFPIFMESFPIEAYEILISTIENANSRLLRANREITANYEVVSAINSIKKADTQNIFFLLESFEKILKCDFILFLEKNIALEDYYTLRYNTQEPGKLQDITIESKGGHLISTDIKKEFIDIGKFQLFESLAIGDEILGYIVICNKKTPFKEEDSRILSGIANSFVGVLRQKEIGEEEKIKEYIKKNRKDS